MKHIFSFRTLGATAFAIFALGLFFAGTRSAFASVTITTATGGSTISADTNTTNGTATWTTLTGPTILETTFQAFPNTGTFIFNTPSGFSFNTSTAVTATITRTAGTGTCFTFTSTSATPTTSTITFTLNARDGGMNTTRCQVVFSNIQVRPTAGTPLATGNITKSGTSNVSGITNGTTNLGTLTEVAGANNKLAYTTQPTTTATTNVNFSIDPVIHLEDQYGNTEISNSTATVSLAPVLSTQACGGTAGNGTLTSTPASGSAVTAGVITSTAMKYSFGEAIKICATATGVTSTLSNTVTVSNLAPTLTSISPTSTTAGGNNFTLTLTGTNFVSNSTAEWNGSSRTTVFASSTQLTATITAADIAVGATSSVTVFTPTLGGGISSAQIFTAVNPVPTIATFSPTSTLVNTSPTLTITGTGFNANTTATFNGASKATTVASSTQLTISLTTANTATTGTSTIVLTNPTPGGGSATSTAFVVLNPVPTTTSISPTSTTAGGASFIVTVSGTNFVSGSVVDFNGSARATGFVSSSSVTSTITAADIAAVGTASITVVNPVPGGGTSNAQTLTINPVNTTTTVNSSATSSVYGSSVTFTATVTPASGGAPTGTVTFKDGASTLGTGILNGANPGVATFSTSTLSVSGSPHSIIAVYGATGIFAGSTSTVLSQTITAKNLTVTGITANNKTYDASTTATLLGTPGTLVGVVGSDAVSLTGTAVGTFATSSVGNNILVTVSGQSLTGAQSSNYSLTEPTTTANITAKNLTVTGITANNKTYDASTTATLNLGSASLVGVIAGDTVTLSTSSAIGTFATSSVGNNILVTISGLSIGGAQSSDYSLTEPTTTANITAKNLTVTGITANNKTYDASTTATLLGTPGTLVGVVGSDAVSLTGTAVGTFATSSVGNNILVTVSGQSLTGAQSSNYSLTEPTTTANITAKNLTVTGITANNKTYDGTTAATLNTGSSTLVGVISGDTVTLNTGGATGTFATSSVGTGILVTVSGLTISGSSSGNYSLTQPTTTANILNPVPTTTSISPTSTIAGGNSFTLTVNGTNFVSGSVVDLNGSARTTTFVSSTAVTATILAGDITTAGTASITVVNPTPGGGTSNAQTFTINNPAPVLTSIAPTSTTSGSSGFTLTLTGTNFIASSSVQWNGSARATTFVSSTTLTAAILTSDLTTPTTSAVTVVNPTPGGGTSGSQTFTVTKTGTSITVFSSATSSVYGNSVTFTATVTPAAGGPPTGVVTFKDGATTLGTGNLNGANPGVATFSTSTLSVAGSVHSITAVYGGDTNFSGSTSTVLSQTITAKNLTVTGITASNKIYDASTTATLIGTPGTLVGVVGSDAVSLTGTAVGTFATSSVGNNILVTVSGQSLAGAQSSNYSLTEPTTTANITQKNLAVSGITANNKTYDASTTATLLGTPGTLVGVVGSDAVSLTGTAVGTFATSSVGNNILVTVSGQSLTGAQSSNYSLTEPTTTANITAKNLTVTGITANNKTYDGTTAATLNTGSSTLVGVISGDTVTLNTGGATGTFATSSVGTGILVTVSGLTISGSSSGNYSLTQPTTTANILNPVPTTTSISPTSTTAGSSGFTLTANGTNFVSGSVVNWSGSARVTTFVSSTTVTATILASDITTAGSYPVTVTNSAPGGGTSNSQTFTVTNSAPVLDSISPTSTTAGSAQFTLTLNGSNFSASSTAEWNGSSLTTTFVSSAMLTAIVPATDVATAGTASVTVMTPAPGGGTSGAQTFTILNPVPTTTSISPTSTDAGGPSFTLTVNGTNFVASSTVDFNGSGRATTFISSTTLTATILASDIATAGTASITVVNSAPGGGTSNSQTLTINNPAPTTSSISPTSTTAGGAQFTLTINGTNFNASSTADFNGSSRVTAFVSSTTLTTTILASDIATAGTASITVVNAAPGGGTSNTQTLTINNPVPTTTSISPTSTDAGGPSFTLTVNGTNFVSGSVVNFNGSAEITNFISSSTLTATIATSDIAVAGSYPVTVTNSTPGGGTSNSQTFTVTTPQNPAPTLSAITPTSTTAGGTGFTLTLTGTGFISSSTVEWNGSSRTTTFVSSTTITAVILASDIATAGTSSITVFNPTPGGGTSNAQTFTITAAANPAPTLVSLSPSSTFAGSSDFTLTATGTNFIGSSVVEWNGSSTATTFVSSTTVTATITAADVAATGTAMITVFNPTPGGGTSTAQTFTVNPAPPGAIKFVFANVSSSAVVGNNVMFNVEAVDSSGTVVTSFEQGVTLTVSGSGTGGGLVTIVNGVGTTTVSDHVAQTVTLGFQDSQSTGLDVSATANVTFVSGPVAEFVLNHPGNMNVGTRLGYMLGREDQFGNFVSASSTAAYLYTNSTSSNAVFFTAASGGTQITSTTISGGSTSTAFWYYDDTSGSRTVTASDNSVAPDGATGIIDATDTFSVAPGAVKFIFANVPSSATAGTSVTLNIEAVDSLNNIDPTYNNGVTVTMSGSATGGGLVTLASGVGTTTITDATAETVTLGFRDTQSTGLGVATTTQIVFNAAAVVTAPVSTAPPTQVPTSGIKPTVVLTFSGMAYPGASVSVISKNGLTSAPVTQATTAAADGSFLISVNNVLRLTGQTYLLSFVDRNGLIAQTKAYNIPSQDKAVYGNILAAPTLGFENASVISRGTPLVVTGYGTPKATIELFVDGNPAGTVSVNDPTGKYVYPLDTDTLSFGRHSVWAVQKNNQNTVEVSGYQNSLSQDEIFVDAATKGTLFGENASGTPTTFIPAVSDGTIILRPVTVSTVYAKQAESDFSNQQSFTISPLADPMLDLNGDGVVDIKDLSVFLSYLKSLSADAANFHITDPNLVKVLDFNHSGVVDVSDLNILVAAILHQ